LNKKWFDINDVLCKPTQMYKYTALTNLGSHFFIMGQQSYWP
jgi:hypothetical protein